MLGVNGPSDAKARHLLLLRSMVHHSVSSTGKSNGFVHTQHWCCMMPKMPGNIAISWRWRLVWRFLKGPFTLHISIGVALPLHRPSVLLPMSSMGNCDGFVHTQHWCCMMPKMPGNIAISWRWRLVWRFLKGPFTLHISIGVALPLHRPSVLLPMSSMGNCDGFVHTQHWYCMTPKMLGIIAISWRWRLVWRGLKGGKGHTGTSWG